MILVLFVKNSSLKGGGVGYNYSKNPISVNPIIQLIFRTLVL